MSVARRVRVVYFPMMSMVSKVTPTPFDQRKPSGMHEPIDPALGWERVIESLHAQRSAL